MEKNLKINEENMLESFITNEKSIEPNPFLVSKIMDRLERANNPVKAKRSSFALQTFALAAGVALAILLGVSLGSSYTQNRVYENAISVNDSQIENLGIYTADE